MNTPAPLNPLPNPLVPSSAVVAGAGLGTTAAIVVSWALQQFWKIEMPAEVSAAVGSIISIGVAYFANGGRAAHTS